MSPKIPFAPGPAQLRIQSIIYRNERAAINRAFESLDGAARQAIASGVISGVSLVWGDCSPEPVLDDDMIAALGAGASVMNAVERVYFGENLGTARGHNRLAEGAADGLTLIMNPDVVFAPDALIELIRPFQRAGVGMTEARQIPIEHPKDYDRETGETCWATTAAAVIPNALLRALDGFDAESFFLYCDDVDFSWRVRMAGYKVIFQPSAAVFHDKRLSASGGWMPSDAERYYSAEAALMMAHKWSRPDLVKRYLSDFQAIEDVHLQKAASVFLQRQEDGLLPAAVDPKHRIGVFTDGNYTRHRFQLVQSESV
jgi:hypothetical protein